MTKQFLGELRRFQSNVFPRYRERYQALVNEGQRPSTLFIGCSDSRLVPTLLAGAEPGELFVVRNIGNLVPPYDLAAGHSTAAAIEYAVGILNVGNIVVCGHSHCGAMRALYEPPSGDFPHLHQWLTLARDARLDEPMSEALLRRTEQLSISLQVERLLSYPLVRERVDQGRLTVHGWYFVIEEGRVEVLDPARGEFVPPDQIADDDEG